MPEQLSAEVVPDYIPEHRLTLYYDIAIGDTLF